MIICSSRGNICRRVRWRERQSCSVQGWHIPTQCQCCGRIYIPMPFDCFFLRASWSKAESQIRWNLFIPTIPKFIFINIIIIFHIMCCLSSLTSFRIFLWFSLYSCIHSFTVYRVLLYLHKVLAHLKDVIFIISQFQINMKTWDRQTEIERIIDSPVHSRWAREWDTILIKYYSKQIWNPEDGI